MIIENRIIHIEPQLMIRGITMKISMNANYYPYLRSIFQAKTALQSDLASMLRSDHTSPSLDCAEPVYWIDSTDALGQPCQIGVTREGILEQYKEWKAQQPPLEVPDQNGWSSANMKFLEERYGNCEDLPVFRRFELLDALQEMNILDGQGLQEKLFPSKIITTDPSSFRCTGRELPDGSWLAMGEDGTQTGFSSREAWENAEFKEQFWGESPIKDFRTLEDILNWVEENKS